MIILIPSLAITGVVEPQAINRLGRYLCFAICAIGIDLLWGYTGVLGLCQAFFFCLGGYAMGMFLSLPGGGGDVRPEYNNIPQFFFFNNVEELPLFWAPFNYLPVALVMGILIPSAIAMIIGYFVFSSRVKGVYFSIITQAIALGAYLMFCRNELLLGGTNGLTNFYKPLNQSETWIIGLYLLTSLVLIGAFWCVSFVTRSRLGRLLLSIRDKEMLLNFIGYKPHMIKVFAFSASAGLAGLAGMLYVPQNGIITPNVMRVEDSIFMVIWVALGGRGHIWGAIFGALVTNLAFSSLTSDLPRVWPFIQGGMFLLVVLAFPDGLSGLWKNVEKETSKDIRSLMIIIAMIVYTFIFCILTKSGVLSFELIKSSGLGAVLKYILLYSPFIWLLKYSKSYTSISLALVLLFFLMTGLNLIPSDAMYEVGTVHVKYYLLGIGLLIPVVLKNKKGLTRYYFQKILGRAA